MNRKLHLNGSDYLMLGFDHELRANGFAGNSCQIVLELSAPVSEAALRRRLDFLLERYPILNARPAGLLYPRWKYPENASRPVPVQTHHEAPGLRERLFNVPLRIHQGELVRFDLVRKHDGRMDILFTWAHAFMDAPGAEHFLAVTGRDELPLPAPPAAAASGGPRPRLSHRVRAAWKNIYQIDRFCQTAPRSLGHRVSGVPPRTRYRVDPFTAEETSRVWENASQYCGALGTARYHAAVALMTLHRLHQRLGRPSPSYVLPVPVGLRPKGKVEPLFSNQVTMLMTQLMPDQLGSVSDAVAALKSQTEQAMREGLIESSRLLTDLFRFLPPPIFMGILKRGLRGEICSLFYGDTAAVSPLFTHFLGAPIVDFTHVAAVTPSPGLGVIFYVFRGLLRVTIMSLTTVLEETEVTGFAVDLRERLLDP